MDQKSANASLSADEHPPLTNSYKASLTISAPSLEKLQLSENMDGAWVAGAVEDCWGEQVEERLQGGQEALEQLIESTRPVLKASFCI